MNTNKPHTPADPSQSALPSEPPFIWPEPRFHCGSGNYSTHPPFAQTLIGADLISGVLVGAEDNTIQWLRGLMRETGNRRIVLVVVVYPAGPTRQEHLMTMKMLQAESADTGRELQIRVLPVDRAFGTDCEKMVLPPTILQAHHTQSGKTWMSIGSVGDAGYDVMCLSSFNAVFQPADGLRDAWRKWFQYLVECAVVLTSDTVQVPQLSPARGDPAAGDLWKAFTDACQGRQASECQSPSVNPDSGNVEVAADGNPSIPWDNGSTALDPLALKLHAVYSNGWLVTVDEATRIRPLTIPVKATLLGQQSERFVGAVVHKQSFSLQVLDEQTAKEIEKHRRVSDLVDLLSFQLGKGNHWLPDAAKPLLDRAIEDRNKKGLAVLRTVLGIENDEKNPEQKPAQTDAAAKAVKTFIAGQRKRIQDDLNQLYRELGQGKSVPADKLQTVLSEVETRLRDALGSRVTPRTIYNRIHPPDLTASAPDENWSQPFSLMLRAARLLRESLVDPWFPRRLSGLSFASAQLEQVMNIFDDVITTSKSRDRADRELLNLNEIEGNKESLQNKSRAVMAIIKGQPVGSSMGSTAGGIDTHPQSKSR